MRLLNISGLLFLLCLVGGCHTLNKSECETVDWRELGHTDGARGREAIRLSSHIEACGRYGITPDKSAYQAGREEGLRQYCRPENALNIGREGAANPGVCTGQAGMVFNQYYRRGAYLHDLNRDLAQLQQRLELEVDVRNEVTGEQDDFELTQNIRYLKHAFFNLRRQYDEAQQVIAAGRDPILYDLGQWQREIPYPETSTQLKLSQAQAISQTKTRSRSISNLAPPTAQKNQGGRDTISAAQCFWIENQSGNFHWVPANTIQKRSLTKADCVALDSCNGGQGLSAGGCYKWSVAPDGPRIP